MAAFDLVIRDGTVIDGTGAAPINADIGIIGKRIAEVGKVAGSGAEEIDARGKLVTPGFVDIHTHYDAQAVWDSHLAPSSWHGVTTAVFGNCGVGFAPCKPADREKLVELMEGVEDIPGAVMHEGLQVGVGVLRRNTSTRSNAGRATSTSVRCCRTPPCACSSWASARSTWRTPTRATSPTCARLPAEAMQAGAFGFSTSRSLSHKTLERRSHADAAGAGRRADAASPWACATPAPACWRSCRNGRRTITPNSP